MNLDASWLVITKVFAVVMTITALALAGGFVFLVWKLSRLLDRLMKRVDPILKRAEEVAGSVSQTAQTLTTRAQRVSAQAEERIDKATATLECAADSIRQAAAGPAGSTAALLTGLVKGLKSTAKDAQKPPSAGAEETGDAG